jgi:hypothetical protein
MSTDRLHTIQTLQFQDRQAAEALLIEFIRETFPLEVNRVELRPLAVSLNSFNGFITLADGKRLFFKTHAEADNVISEYYNAQRLAEAGYPVIQPILSSTEAGKQLLIYEVIDSPSVFDLAWAIENGNDSHHQGLTEAQNAADDLLFQLYQKTLEPASAKEVAMSPVHQLFYHRLTGGRLARFYGNSPFDSDQTQVALPNGISNMQQVRQVTWHINGQLYRQNLDAIIKNAIQLLNPWQAGPSIIGHGDAHNGNVFFQANDVKHRPSLLYFDPAFAGRHDPLLDIVKPLFHNVFAMWMYFPKEKTTSTHIILKVKDDLWEVEHNYQLHPIRLMFLRSKIDRVVIPLIQLLHRENLLRSDWRAYLKTALFCCPFLTMNLADQSKFTPIASLLGLTMSMEMGAESYSKRSLIDLVLDEVEQSIL